VASSRIDDIPPDVRHEARRALLNFIGCAVGAAAEDAVSIAIRVLMPFAGGGTAAILGRKERLDPLRAALVNGISSHVLDFDDTTPKTYSHTTSPVAAALFGYAGASEVSGIDLLHAFILGFEVASRVGNAISSAHYDAGWHITSTTGVIGAAAAIGRLRGLDDQRMMHAIGLAATQASGFREMFGSMAKSFHPGRAAESGYLAVLLAEQGFTSGRMSLDGPRGYFNVLSAKHDASCISRGLGVDFNLRKNTYKPFACGLVIHPTIDACSQIRLEPEFSIEGVEAISLLVSPIVLDLCNKKNISSGLESKFSVYHAAAIGLVCGKGGLAEFTDEAVHDPVIKGIRERVSAASDPLLRNEAVMVKVSCRDGRVFQKQVNHPVGSLEHPLSDKTLEEKVRELALPYLTTHGVNGIVDMIWDIEAVQASALVRAATSLR
jgi:2-methylcitrate dehydratase PrpD